MERAAKSPRSARLDSVASQPALLEKRLPALAVQHYLRSIRFFQQLIIAILISQVLFFAIIIFLLAEWTAGSPFHLRP